MSSDSQEKRSEVLRGLAHELRQFNGLGASFFRSAASRVGMTVTDLQVIDILDSTGPATAGQLADLTGLTTGAITGMLNRLEEIGLVHRERDPNDGRKVIVHLERGKDQMQEINSNFDSLGMAWNEMVARYDDEQVAFLLDFLKQSNEISRAEIVRLRDVSSGGKDSFSAQLGDVESGRLIVSSGVSQLILRSNERTTELYQANFKGPMADVKVKDGVVTIRYPRRMWVLGGEQRVAEVALNVTIPWWITIQGGASDINAKLGNLNLAGLEVKGGLSSIRLELPTPSAGTPIRISGGASEITIRRPAGVAARAHLKGWVSEFIFDDQTLSGVGNDVQLQSPGFDTTAPYYDIEVASSASTITITAE